MARASATPTPEPEATEEAPATEDQPTDETQPAPEPETTEEAVAEEPSEDDPPAPTSGRWKVLTRIQYEADGNEFICGPGEIIDDDAAAQVDADSIEPA